MFKNISFLIFSLFTTSLYAVDKRPNIIVILSDDMGYTDLGCYGGEIETPNLNNMAAQGLRFTQFYNTGRCCPTRASLLTGLYPHQTGIGHMTQDKGVDGYRGDLNKTSITIAEVLKPAGYSTYLSVNGMLLSIPNQRLKPKNSIGPYKEALIAFTEQFMVREASGIPIH